jgi:hypothetical protein
MFSSFFSPLSFSFIPYVSQRLGDTSADDVNLLGDNINTINENRETLIYASKEVGTEVNTEKSKYIIRCISD